MSDTEYEKFEINDYDLDHEFNPRGRKRPTKNQQIYGIWADDDSDDDAKPSTSSRGRAARQEGRRTKDFTAPIGFVAGGVQQSGKKKEEVVEKEETGMYNEFSHSFDGFEYICIDYRFSLYFQLM